jgi:hypothetical protein
MKGAVVMGVLLGQLPPAELARLKAELAETLIAYFCYPRFFDYRTESLRTRPVDRSKRQEVWLYLSSVDFTAWNRVDLMSPDFQYQVERLFIHFVQRNRSFFGEQGRKRMADIRMLIGSSALSVVQGLRGHLTGQHQHNPPFGSPRPVSSWTTTNITGRLEPGWEQLASSTMFLQQQLQEIRGEIKPAATANSSQCEARPVPAPARRYSRVQPVTTNAMNGIEHQATAETHVPVGQSTSRPHLRRTTHLSEPKNTFPASPPAMPKVEQVVIPVETLVTPVASAAVPLKTPAVATPQLPTPEEVSPPPASVPSISPVPSAVSTSIQPRGLPQPMSTMASSQRESSTVLVGEGDMAIFEQMRHQLIVWLRIEAIRSGIEISNQGPSQLLELLRQQDNFDETRLQIVSTLLNLCNQVMKNGQASLFDYKQALVFHLMHTKR